MRSDLLRVALLVLGLSESSDTVLSTDRGLKRVVEEVAAHASKFDPPIDVALIGSAGEGMPIRHREAPTVVRVGLQTDRWLSLSGLNSELGTVGIYLSFDGEVLPAKVMADGTLAAGPISNPEVHPRSGDLFDHRLESGMDERSAIFDPRGLVRVAAVRGDATAGVDLVWAALYRRGVFVNVVVSGSRPAGEAGEGFAGGSLARPADLPELRLTDDRETEYRAVSVGLGSTVSGRTRVGIGYTPGVPSDGRASLAIIFGEEGRVLSFPQGCAMDDEEQAREVMLRLALLLLPDRTSLGGFVRDTDELRTVIQRLDCRFRRARVALGDDEMAPVVSGELIIRVDPTGPDRLEVSCGLSSGNVISVDLCRNGVIESEGFLAAVRFRSDRRPVAERDGLDSHSPRGAATSVVPYLQRVLFPSGAASDVVRFLVVEVYADMVVVCYQVARTHRAAELQFAPAQRRDHPASAARETGVAGPQGESIAWERFHIEDGRGTSYKKVHDELSADSGQGVAVFVPGMPAEGEYLALVGEGVRVECIPEPAR